MPPKLLIPATCLMVLVVSVSTAVFYLKNIRRRAFLALLLGALPGSLAGLGILLFTPVPFLQISAGAIMVLYTIWQFCHPAFAPHGDSWLSGSIAGFASGLVNTSISFGNPPVAIYSLWAGWSKEDTMGTMNVFTICATILTCTALFHGAPALRSCGDSGHCHRRLRGPSHRKTHSAGILPEDSSRHHRRSRRCVHVSGTFTHHTPALKGYFCRGAGFSRRAVPRYTKKGESRGTLLFFFGADYLQGNSHDAGNAAREIAETHQISVPVEFQPVAVTPGSDKLLSLPVKRKADETEQHGPPGQA